MFCRTRAADDDRAARTSLVPASLSANRVVETHPRRELRVQAVAHTVLAAQTQRAAQINPRRTSPTKLDRLVEQGLGIIGSGHQNRTNPTAHVHGSCSYSSKVTRGRKPTASATGTGRATAERSLGVAA